MKHFLYIFMLLCFVGCNSIDKPKKPDNLIPKDKMADIMYDLYILNAAKGVNRKLLELNGIMPVDYVFKKHNIDSLQFANSNTYYSYNSDTYTTIIDKVTERLKKDKKVYEKITKEDQRITDSIQNVGQREEKPIDTIPAEPMK